MGRRGGGVALSEGGSTVDTGCLVGRLTLAVVESGVLWGQYCRSVTEKQAKLTKLPGMVKPQLTACNQRTVQAPRERGHSQTS